MSISIWRYSHLALAVSSFIFIFLASVTGIILAFQPISEQLQPFKVADLEEVTVAETISAFQEKYPEIIDIKVDTNHFVMASVFTEEGDNLEGYFNPKTAEYLGEELKPSPFFQWVTNFHRSLFLKSVGRFFVGLCSFLLFLIAVSGTVLIVKRQRSFKKFFAKIVNDDFNQYWHVVLGRLSLIPIIIITATGVYLSFDKFDLLPQQEAKHQVDFESLSETPKQNISDFDVFKNTALSEIQSIEFPFSPDVEDYFTLKLNNKEMLVNQFTGEVLSDINISKFSVFSAVSLNLHTGKGSILWSVILAIATVNILFFIYSGFAMTFKRRASRLKNKFKMDDAEFIILVGSENGSTVGYANALHKQLIAAGRTSYITELNHFSTFKKAKHIVAITATYGQGEAPTNANKFLKLVEAVEQEQPFSFSVVGFGSLAYPDFCKFAEDVNHAFLKLKNTTQLTELHTINDKSFEAFDAWVKNWSSQLDLTLTIPEDKLTAKPKNLKRFAVVEKELAQVGADNMFSVTLKPKWPKTIKSGDLLAIYPKNDHRERLYSIGRINGHVHLSVKLHEHGLGSGYLNDLSERQTFKARIVKNPAFYFPKKASRAILIANGTGIAPFLGMIDENKNQVETHLYWGIRRKSSSKTIIDRLQTDVERNRLKKLNLVCSQEDQKQYVQNVIKADADLLAKTLNYNGVIMVCGSLAMQNSVFAVLKSICAEHSLKPFEFYRKNQQIKTDCY